MGKKKKPIPGTVKLGYNLQWFRGTASQLIDKYPVEVEGGTNRLDFIEPWVQLVHMPSYIDGYEDMYWPFIEALLLYRKFARIDENDPNEILKFINKYGLLGIHTALFDTGHHIESIARWRFEIREMRAMLELWEIYRYAFDSRLRPYISNRAGERIFTFKWREEWKLNHIDIGLPYDVALTGDCNSTTTEIGQLVLDYVNGRIHDIVIGFDTATLSMIYQPSNLISAMWIMFLVEEILNESNIAICRNCGDPFILLHKGKIYCEGRCKVMAHRKGLSRRRSASAVYPQSPVSVETIEIPHTNNNIP